jgi:hypothetical protein
LTEDRRLLIEALRERFGRKVQHFEGVWYFDGWLLNIEKLEADYKTWCDSERRSRGVSSGS